MGPKADANILIFQKYDDTILDTSVQSSWYDVDFKLKS